MTVGSEYNIPEPHFTLAHAAKRIYRVNNKRVHVSTLWRWCRKGVRGVCLEYRKIGRSIVVSDSGLNRFFLALAEADATDLPSIAAPRKRRARRRTNSAGRQRDIDATNEVLRRAGILTDNNLHSSTVGAK